MGKNQKRNRAGKLSSSGYRQSALTRVAESLLACKVVGVEYPGGRSRESYRLIPETGESFIATRRREVQRARLEVRTLRALNRHGVRVPELLGTNHAHIVLQQDIGGTRLSRALVDTTSDRRFELLSAALESLSAIQGAATAEGLEQHVTTIGDSPLWLQGLLARPAAIGRHLNVPAPTLELDALAHKLRVREPRFIKWDARPGNALVCAESHVYWFDWEHASRRNRLDDVAWLLGDEFIPDDAAVERDLLEQHLPAFSDSAGPREPLDYLMIYGCLHITVRLGLVLKYMDGNWWDLDECIEHDKVGVTLDCARNLCARGARWAESSSLSAPLADWFRALVPRLEAL